jgi:hypothetical protein
LPISMAFLYISLRDHSDGALQIVTCLWNYPVKESPSPRSQQNHLWRDRPLSRAFFYISLYPEKRIASFYNHRSQPQYPILSQNCL